MEALRASYADSSSDSEDDMVDSSLPTPHTDALPADTISLPPPPLSLLTVPNSFGVAEEYLQNFSASRIRGFPHVDGNYSLHVYIPVYIPLASKKQVAWFLRKVSALVPGLNVVDVDVPLSIICKDDQKLEQVALGREFHVSLGRTVPIRRHQIDTIAAMLRQKLQNHKGYSIDFSKWEVFVNDDQTRSFVSLEVVKGGLAEITRQIEVVNEVYKLHNLPEFYKNPRPHISLAWGLGDMSNSLKKAVEDEIKRTSLGRHVFSCKFSGIECKIGNKSYKICKLHEEKKFIASE